MSKKQSWYSIKAKAKNAAGVESAEIFIFEEIGAWGIKASTFIEQVQALNVDRIDLHLNSPGGDVFEGVAIQRLLKSHKAKVSVHIDGLAASIASVIALAGDEIRIGDNAYVMIHNPTTIAYGEAEDFRKKAELLDKITNGIAGDYARKMGITVDDARELMNAETWYLGQEAVDAGFADSTYEGAAIAARFDLNKISNKAPAEAVAAFQTKPDQPENHKPDEVPTMGKTQENAGKDTGEDNKTPQNNAGAPAKETPKQPEAPKAPEAVDTKAIVAAELKKDRERAAAINDLGEKFGFVAEAKEFAKDGKSVADFREHILAKSPDAWRNTLAVKNPANSGTDDGEDVDDGSELRDKVLALRKKRTGLA